MTLLDLEKAYDRVEEESLWKLLRIYSVNTKLLKELKFLYSDSKACIEVNGKLTA